MSPPVASVRDLRVSFPVPGGELRAVDGVSLEVAPGATVGVVGESGCGKTMTALSLMGLVPPPGKAVATSIRLGGREMVGARREQWRRLRGSVAGMVFQEPMTSLHPTLSVGRQVGEALLAHNPDLDAAAVRRRSVELLEEVGIPEPARRAGEYPHTWSGGMRQRAMIAIALANRPRLLIADEPTTALDVTIQAQILALLRRLRDDHDMALILITHDLGVIAEMCDTVAVMYAGRVVEEAAASTIFARPRHPYTRALLRSLPRIDRIGWRVPAISGRPPRILGDRRCCSFAPRCDLTVDTCLVSDPPLLPVGGDGSCACFRVDVAVEESVDPDPPARRVTVGKSLLEVEGVTVAYPISSGLIGRTRKVKAVEDISFTLRQGSTLALVGESGCGKTTMAKAVLRLVDPEEGRISFRGTDISRLPGRKLRSFRRQVQAVFQDPFGSLNPRKTVFEIVASPLKVNGEWKRGSETRVWEALDMVGLDRDHGSLRPAALSGGQRQRVGVARALIMEPAVVILDEPVSALDVSIQAQVLNLLVDLRDRLGLSYLFIAHDLSVVASLADRVAVMYLGRIVESGTTEQVFTDPAHPYTRALLASVPRLDPTAPRTERVLSGEVPSILHPPSGCRFRTRCPLAQPVCAEVEPPLEGEGHRFACHFPWTDNAVAAGA